MRGVLVASQACAPRYYWRTEHNTPFADVTGTCFLSVDGLETFVEFAPCRTGELLQRFCQHNTVEGQHPLRTGTSGRSLYVFNVSDCFSFHEGLLAFLVSCAVRCRTARTCWTGLLSGGI